MSVWIYIPSFYYHSFLGSLKDYQLYAVCFYSGVGSEGHYYAEALSPSNNVWLRFSAVDICCVTTPGMKNDIPTLMFYRLSTLLWTIHSGETPHSVTPPSLTPSTPLPNNSPLSQTSPIIPNPISPSESPNLSNPIPLLNTTSPSQTMQLPESIPLPNTLATPPHSFHSSVLTTPVTSHASRQPQISSTNTLSSPFHDRVFRTTAVTSAPEAFHTVLFACHICGFTCSRSRTLAKHIQHQHSSYKCSLCDFRTKDSASLSVHIHKSHTAPFICSAAAIFPPFEKPHDNTICGSISLRVSSVAPLLGVMLLLIQSPITFGIFNEFIRNLKLTFLIRINLLPQRALHTQQTVHSSHQLSPQTPIHMMNHTCQSLFHCHLPLLSEIHHTRVPISLQT